MSLLAAGRFGSMHQDQLFWSGIRTSAAIHAAMVIFALIISLVFVKPPLKFAPSIRVDLVALPDIKKSDLDKYTADDLGDLSKKLNEASKGAKKLLEEAEKEPEPPPVPDDTMVKKEVGKPNKKQALKNAIDRIKALSEMEAEVKKSSEKIKVVPKGNAVSEGNSLTGPATNDTNAYVAKLQSKLRDNWNLPVWLSKQNLDAKIVIFLDKGGYIRTTVFAKSSGNAQFDDYALKTVRMAQPFGPPPDEIIDSGITLGFPL